MSKIEIDASRSNLRISADGLVALVIGSALAAIFLVAGVYIVIS